jgi:hypothetical protein
MCVLCARACACMHACMRGFVGMQHLCTRTSAGQGLGFEFSERERV